MLFIFSLNYQATLAFDKPYWIKKRPYLSLKLAQVALVVNRRAEQRPILFVDQTISLVLYLVVVFQCTFNVLWTMCEIEGPYGVFEGNEIERLNKRLSSYGSLRPIIKSRPLL